MAKHVVTGTPRKTVGAYLKVIKALNELNQLGEDVDFHAWDPAIVGITGGITRDTATGQWRFVQA